MYERVILSPEKPGFLPPEDETSPPWVWSSGLYKELPEELIIQAGYLEDLTNNTPKEVVRIIRLTKLIMSWVNNDLKRSGDLCDCASCVLQREILIKEVRSLLEGIELVG